MGYGNTQVFVSFMRALIIIEEATLTPTNEIMKEIEDRAGLEGISCSLKRISLGEFLF